MIALHRFHISTKPIENTITLIYHRLLNHSNRWVLYTVTSSVAVAILFPLSEFAIQWTYDIYQNVIKGLHSDSSPKHRHHISGTQCNKKNQDTHSSSPEPTSANATPVKASRRKSGLAKGPISEWSLEDLKEAVLQNIVTLTTTRREDPTQYLDVPFFPPLLEELLHQISAAARHHSILLVEGAPGIGKGVALEVYSQQMKGLHLSLEDVLPDLSNYDSEPEDLSDAWVRILRKSFGFPYERHELRHLLEEDQDFTMFAFQIISSALRDFPRLPVTLVVQDIHLLFSHQQPLSNVYSHLFDSLFWLLHCQSEGLLSVVLGSSSKSALVGLQKIRGLQKRIRFKALESGVDNESITEYLLTQVNPTLSPEKKFTSSSAVLFAETFEANLRDLALYCNSNLSVEEFIEERESEFLGFLSKNIPKNPNKKGYVYDPFSPSISDDDEAGEFREIILDMIMRNGVLPIAHLDSSHLALLQVLVENNFLRWRNSPLSQRASRLKRASKASLTSRSTSPAPTLSTMSMDESISSSISMAHTSRGSEILGSLELLRRPSDFDENDHEDEEVEEDIARDPLSFLRRGNTELVWFNKIVRNVCERWFNEHIA